MNEWMRILLPTFFRNSLCRPVIALAIATLLGTLALLPPAYAGEDTQQLIKSNQQADDFFLTKKEAERGDAKAQFRIGRIYDFGLAGAKGDKALAAKWYEKAALQGYLQAQLRIGELYEFGMGVTRDYEQAEKWFKMAAEQGSPVAEWRLRILSSRKKDMAKRTGAARQTAKEANNTQVNKPSGKSYETRWAKGTWSGEVSFSNVLCATAPNPEKTVGLTQTMFGGGRIYHARIEYPDKISAYIVSSTIPAGRSANDDVAKLLRENREKARNARAKGVTYEVTEMSTAFGPTIGMRINNVIGDTRETGPFPLNFSYAAPNQDAQKDILMSMSVHRLFARGPDRFEIAVMQVVNPPISLSGESEMEKRLTTIADYLVNSLQRCTGALPIRASSI